ncbi:hypothetical protein [Nostoc commune]|nr:hypothetical protein [Nostoc commune]
MSVLHDQIAPLMGAFLFLQDLRIDKLNKKCVEMNQQKTGDRYANHS